MIYSIYMECWIRFFIYAEHSLLWFLLFTSTGYSIASVGTKKKTKVRCWVLKRIKGKWALNNLQLLLVWFCYKRNQNKTMTQQGLQAIVLQKKCYRRIRNCNAIVFMVKTEISCKVMVQVFYAKIYNILWMFKAFLKKKK